MRVILDGVFNHLSSDSPYFDRYHHFASVGACESVNSPYRSWFYFQDQAGGPCVGPNGPNTMTYTGWAGFSYDHFGHTVPLFTSALLVLGTIALGYGIDDGRKAAVPLAS